MEVILKQDVKNIGKAGSVVKVKDGYARNFLVPNGLAVLSSSGNLKKLEQEKQKKAEVQEKIKAEAEAFKERLSAVSLTISALSKEEDELYGSIGPHDISAALKDEGIELDKAFILLDEPIKTLGIYEVPIKLHPEVTTKIKVWIVKK
ncbi:MAG: 50S ribosomal protein L9 [Candidatus Omnitrophica bacterium]|nr:50S ribosomal protein L9 [Candidatus Omnitrophota bacterium]MBU1868931.1 50S ribosomal protein L9 [Candidatus Omnitrophota bacterium]